jgi:hypothetical protein
MKPASHLALFKSSIIGGLRAEDEVGSAADEERQRHVHHHLLPVPIINGHQLFVDVSIIANHLHPYM